MNTVNSLYSVTRLNWFEAQQNELVMKLFKKSKSFAFPLAADFETHPLLCKIKLPLLNVDLPESIYIYIFGPTVVQWITEIPAEWHHYIKASLNALIGINHCFCCENLMLRNVS